MTPEALLRITTGEKGCYETPELNEKLYLNRKGFRRIQNLEPYTGLVALFLDSNGLRAIENLGHLTQMRMLYLDNNCIERIEGLENLTELQTLSLSANSLTAVDGLETLHKLETLNVARNKLCTLEALRGVRAAPLVSSLDVSFNHIADTEAVADTVAALAPELKCLYFHHNPNQRFLQNYRRAFISAIPTLMYLDERPVKEIERRTSEAWGRGESRAEIEAARVAYLEEQRLAHIESCRAFRLVQAERCAEVAQQRAGESVGGEEGMSRPRPLGSSSAPLPRVPLAPGTRDGASEGTGSMHRSPATAGRAPDVPTRRWVFLSTGSSPCFSGRR